MLVSSVPRVTRRQAVQAAGKALAGAASLHALSSLSGARGLPDAAESPRPERVNTDASQKLRIATCQFPVSATSCRECEVHPGFHASGGRAGRTLLHTSEASLSG